MASISGSVPSLTCGRCLNHFPNVSIISCGTVLVLCRACHRRVHPGCAKAVSIVPYADKMCKFCRAVPAILLCPLCGQTDDDQAMLALCQRCSDQLHHNGASIHTDHIMAIPV